VHADADADADAAAPQAARSQWQTDALHLQQLYRYK
jgi:hypothetical protein